MHVLLGCGNVIGCGNSMTVKKDLWVGEKGSGKVLGFDFSPFSRDIQGIPINLVGPI